MDDATLAELHRRMRLGLDAIGVIEVLAQMKPRSEVRQALQELLDEGCDIELPKNVRLPLESIVDHFGLLEGILRVMK